MCFDFLHKFCLKNFSFWEEMEEIWSKTNFGLHVKSDFNDTRIFLDRLSKNIKIPHLIKICPEGY